MGLHLCRSLSLQSVYSTAPPCVAWWCQRANYWMCGSDEMWQCFLFPEGCRGSQSLGVVHSLMQPTRASPRPSQQQHHSPQESIHKGWGSLRSTATQGCLSGRPMHPIAWCGNLEILSSLFLPPLTAGCCASVKLSSVLECSRDFLSWIWNNHCWVESVSV